MSSFRDRLIACYQGKNIGGTLGAPHEGRNHTLNLTYYDPVPTEVAFNDDLDLQLVWLRHMQEYQFRLGVREFGQAWIDHIDFHADEYGYAIANLKKGIFPPSSGYHNNFFINGLGAAIRSEIWAALFPGRPEIAAWYAYGDGSVDHSGDGVLALVYLSILESDLFVSGDLASSMRRAWNALPDSSRLKKVIERVRVLYDSGVGYEAARATIMSEFGSFNCSDCVMNMGWIQIGLLYGEGDFGRSILAAVNCGQDTDSTGATVGAILGIWKGRAGIASHWLAPIGNQIRLSPCIRDLKAPPTIEALVDEIELMHELEPADLPRLTFPVEFPEPAEFSEEVEWSINGRRVILPGTILDSRRFQFDPHSEVVYETEVVSPVDREVRLLVCASGLNKAFFDDRLLGEWGAVAGSEIPAFHRTCGGCQWRVRMKAGVRHRLKITIFTFDRETPLVYCAMADTGEAFRHLHDISWGLQEK